MLHQIAVRLTNLCNENCKHCVYRSGPQFNTHLTIELADQINKWFSYSLPVLTNISMFGGELTLIPNYPDLINTLCHKIDQAGIITNGIFVENNQEFHKFLDTVIGLSVRKLTIIVSQSQYHSPEKYGLKAYKKLRKYLDDVEGKYVQLSGHIKTVIPFGRAFDNQIWINDCKHDAMCDNALRDHIFIDEEGFTCLCSLGKVRYKHISEDSHFNIMRKIRQWQEYRLERGMNCLSCSQKGIGYHRNQIANRHKSTTYCNEGQFNGEL